MKQVTEPRRYGKMQRTFHECMTLAIDLRGMQSAMLNRATDRYGLSFQDSVDKLLSVSCPMMWKLRGTHYFLFVDPMDDRVDAEAKWNEALDEALGLKPQ